VGNIEPKKVHNTPSSPLPNNVSFSKSVNIIDFTPPAEKEEPKPHRLSPVKVRHVDTRNYEEGGPRN